MIKRAEMVGIAHRGALPPNVDERLRSTDPLATVMLHLAGNLLRGIPDDARDRVGVVLGSTRGSLEADIAFDQSRRADDARYASPAAFARTLPSTLAAELSVKFRLPGPSLTLCAGNASAAFAVARARSWMRHLGLMHCLAGGCDVGAAPGTYRAGLLFLTDWRGEWPAVMPQRLDLAAPHDASLDALIAWIKQRDALAGDR